MLFTAPGSHILMAQPARDAAPLHEGTFDAGYAAGRAAAETKFSGTEWTLYGAGAALAGGFFGAAMADESGMFDPGRHALVKGTGGFLLGLAGTGLVVGISLTKKPRPLAEEVLSMRASGTAFQLGYVAGFKEQAGKRAAKQALVGGLAGSLLMGIMTALL